MEEILITPLDVRYDGGYTLYLIISSRSNRSPSRAQIDVEYGKLEVFRSQINLENLGLPVLVSISLPPDWNHFNNLPAPYQLLISKFSRKQNKNDAESVQNLSPPHEFFF